MDDFGDKSRDDFGESLMAGRYVVDDSSPTRLAITWSGPPPYLKLRLAAVAPLLAVLVGVSIVGVREWDALQGAPLDVAGIAFVGLGGAMLLLFVTILGSLLASFVGYWRDLVWDGSEQQFTARRKGWFVWGNQKVVVPIASRARFELELGRETSKPLPIKFRTETPAQAAEYESHAFEITLPEITRRNQALELLLKIGRALGAKGYVINHDETRRASLRVVLDGDPLLSPRVESRHEADEEDWDDEEEEGDEDEFDEDDDDEYDSDVSKPPTIHAIPGPGQAPPMALGSRETSVGTFLRGRPAYAPETTEIDFEKLEKRMEQTQVDSWRLGEEVTLIRPDPPKYVYSVAMVFAAIAGGVIGYWPLHGVLAIVLGLTLGASKLSAWGVAIAAGVFAGALGGILAYNRFRRREVTLHWGRRQLVETIGDTVRQWPLSDVRGVIFTAKAHRDHDTDSTSSISRTSYGGRLDLVLADEREVLLLETDRWENELEDVGRLLAPLGHNLAEQLGVPYRVDDEGGATEGTDRQGWLQFSVLQYGVLSVILLGAIGGLTYSGAGNARFAEAREKIRRAGADVILSGYTGPGNRVVLKDYSGVRFNEGTPDSSLAGLRSAFEQIPDLGVDLEKCPVTDVAMAELANLPNLKILDLSETQVTDIGLTTLGELPGLVFIDLTLTQITDEGLAQLARMQGLKFIYLPLTFRVTDTGIDHLHALKNLELVILPAQISDECAARLKEARPKVHIIQAGKPGN